MEITFDVQENATVLQEMSNRMNCLQGRVRVHGKVTEDLPSQYDVRGDVGALDRNGDVVVSHGATLLRALIDRVVRTRELARTAIIGFPPDGQRCRGYRITFYAGDIVPAGDGLNFRQILRRIGEFEVESLDEVLLLNDLYSYQIMIACPRECASISGDCRREWLWHSLLGGVHYKHGVPGFCDRRMLVSELLAQIAALHTYYSRGSLDNPVDGGDLALLAMIIGLVTGHIPTTWCYAVRNMEQVSPIGPLIGLLKCVTN